MPKERLQRSNERVSAEVPVRLKGGAAGFTRDLSPSGVYFFIDEKVEPGQTIHFSIEFENPGDRGGLLYLDCAGLVIRTEDANGKLGVAVAMTESKLERRERASRKSRVT